MWLFLLQLLSSPLSSTSTLKCVVFRLSPSDDRWGLHWQKCSRRHCWRQWAARTAKDRNFLLPLSKKHQFLISCNVVTIVGESNSHHLPRSYAQVVPILPLCLYLLNKFLSTNFDGCFSIQPSWCWNNEKERLLW